MKKTVTKLVKASDSVLPADYQAFLAELKAKIRAAQVRAALAASAELIRLYWDIGRRIVEQQQREGWGAFVIGRLAADLQSAFPGIGGFSKQNIWYMRKFYLEWSRAVPILQRSVGELD